MPPVRLSRTGRLAGVLAGIFLLAPGLGLSLITYVLLFDKEPPGFGGVALAGAIFCVAFWFLNLSRRLILGRAYSDGGLFSPLELRVLACCMIAIPVISLFAGYWRTPGRPFALQLGVLLAQATFYILAALAFFKKASLRQAGSRDVILERHTSVEPPP